MRVLMLSTDRNMLDANSAVYKRTRRYAEEFGHVDAIVFTTGRGGNVVDGPLHICPTNSLTRLSYGFSAFWIARGLSKPDIVTVQDPFETGLAAYFISLVKGIPFHVQIHTDLFSPEYRRHSFVNRLRVAIARFVIARAAGIRVVSERVKRDLETRFKLHVPVTVLPIFVDVERFHYAIPDPLLTERFAKYSHRVLVVSRLESEKNTGLAIHAFAENAPENACLIIVGDGRERGALEELAHSQKLGKHIFFEGRQDPVAYYKSADIVLFSSHYDGYGLVVAEALAAGKPVLSTDVGAARELGAIISTPDAFGEKLGEWFQRGSREGHLQNYRYKHFEEYLHAYCADIASAAR